MVTGGLPGVYLGSTRGLPGVYWGSTGGLPGVYRDLPGETLTLLNPQFVAGEQGLFGGHESEDIRTISSTEC